MGKSGIYTKKVESTKGVVGVLKVNVPKKVVLFQSEDDAYETYSEVPELAEVQQIVKGTMGQAMQQAVEQNKEGAAQVAKQEAAPAKATVPAVAVAHSSVPAARKNVSFGIDWAGLPKEAVIDMGGKPYITKAGLSFVGMKAGVRSVKVQPIRWSFEKYPDGQQVAIASATVTMDDGREYQDYGIAHTGNTTAMIVKGGNLDHMASTRASNRALRLATACGYCSIEELPEPPQHVIDAEFTDA